MNIRHILSASIIFTFLLLHSQQSFADLIAMCYGSQSEFVKCRGNSDISSISISRGTLIKNIPTIPADSNVITGLTASLNPLEAKFIAIAQPISSLGTAFYFECAITPAENPLLFQTASTIISASSSGLDSENSYYTKNSLIISRNGNKRCTNIGYSKSWVR